MQDPSPKVTVAVVVEEQGAFLMVEEHTPEGLRLNQPAGHLDPFETPEDGAIRETLEESARHFKPEGLLGIYLSRYRPGPGSKASGIDVCYLRLAFVGAVSNPIEGRSLDHGIIRAGFIGLDEIRRRHAEHRSPLVMQCIEDYLAIKRGDRSLLPLAAVFTHPEVLRR